MATTKRAILLALGILALAMLVIACGDGDGQPGPSPQQTGTPAGVDTPEGPTGTPGPTPDLSSVVIMRRDGPCPDACPQYRLTIRGDGSVEYEGFEAVAVTGTEIATIPLDDVRRLFSEFDAIGFTSLQPEYPCPPSDEPQGSTITTFIPGPGEDIAVERCALSDAPPELESLETLIDETANSARWVEGTE